MVEIGSGFGAGGLCTIRFALAVLFDWMVRGSSGSGTDSPSPQMYTEPSGRGYTSGSECLPARAPTSGISTWGCSCATWVVHGSALVTAVLRATADKLLKPGKKPIACRSLPQVICCICRLFGVEAIMAAQLHFGEGHHRLPPVLHARLTNAQQHRT